jgi:hypothetical protein
LVKDIYPSLDLATNGMSGRTLESEFDFHLNASITNRKKAFAA